MRILCVCAVFIGRYLCTEKGVKKNAHVCINVFFSAFFYVHRRNKLVLYTPYLPFRRDPTRSSRYFLGLSNFFSRKPVPGKSGQRLLFPESTRTNSVWSENRADRFQKKSYSVSLNKEKYSIPSLKKVAYVAALFIGI